MKANTFLTRNISFHTWFLLWEVLEGRMPIVADGGRLHKEEISCHGKRADLPPLPDEKPRKRGLRRS